MNFSGVSICLAMISSKRLSGAPRSCEQITVEPSTSSPLTIRRALSRRNGVMSASSLGLSSMSTRSPEVNVQVSVGRL